MPAPENGKWPYADCYVGDGWSVAYRTLDAQYFGVAQRRRRIYLVADFGGERAAEILFESESLPGDLAQGIDSGEGSSGDASPGSGESGSLQSGGTVISFEPGAASRLGGHCEENRCGALRASMGDNQLAVAIENHPTDSRVKVDERGTVQTLTSRMGTGGMNVPLIMSERHHGLPVTENIAQTLMGTDYKGVQCVCEATPKTMKVRSGCEGGGKGVLVQEDKSATLGCSNDQTLFVPAVYGISSDKSNAMLSENPCSGIYLAKTARTIDKTGGNPSCNQGGMVIVSLSTVSDESSIDDPAEEPASFYPYMKAESQCFRRDGKANTLINGSNPGCQNGILDSEYIVRRLTPTECARLQGFPDHWCHSLESREPPEEEISNWYNIFETYRKAIGKSTKPRSRKQIEKWLKDPYSDAAEYKVWGNGVALPCVYFVLKGIVNLPYSK